MEINKQLFEDVLSGKLKGKFVFRNTCSIYGVELKPNHICIQEASKKDFYIIRMPDILFNVVDSNGKSVYCCIKHKGEMENDSNFDVVNFITDTNMKETELKIEIPKGQEIDWQESAKQEKIVFKKINTKPRSWKEYLEQYKNVPCYELGFDVSGGYWNKSTMYGVGYCAVPSKELAEAFLAMMQLMSLRQAWIGNWKPDWSDSNKHKWCIINDINRFVISAFSSCSRGLSFPTLEMAEAFMNCFKDLLKVAKPLI